MIGSMSNRAKFKILTATPKNNFTATGAPTTSDDIRKGYSIGSKWLVASTGNEWTCKANGTGAAKWSHTPRVLVASAIPVSCPADISEDNLATITIPANSMGLNGMVSVHAVFTFSASTNSKSFKAKWDGNNFHSSSSSSSAIAGEEVFCWIRNANSTSSQISKGLGYTIQGGTYGSNQSFSADTTIDKTILITGQKASSGETLTLLFYEVILTLPDIG